MVKMIMLTGRVQGVGCRYYCAETAKRMDIHGAVQNLSDGRVRILFYADDMRASEYARSLSHNPFGLRFYGTIERLEMSDYSGLIEGEYEW